MKELDDIVEVFELLGDWDARYQYLVELGEQMEAMPLCEKSEANRVQGCMSQVWVKAYQDPTHPELIYYRGDCDTPVIKGVLALLIKMISNKSPKKVRELDVDELFERLSLDDHLSPNRHVGVYGIVELMKTQADELLKKMSEAA